MMLIRCFDTETSGEEPNIHVIEVGWCNIVPIYHADDVPHHWEMDAPKAILCDPGYPDVKISPESSGVHHITDAMVMGMDTPELALARAFDVPSDTIFAAHNADYDKALCGDSQHQW